MQTYVHGVLEELPEDTRTLAEKQRDALLAAAEQMLRAYPQCLGGTGQVAARDKLRATVDAVEAGKVPS